MRNLPSFPASVIKTILPKPQIMVIAVSLPIELFNKKSGAMRDSYFGSYLNQHREKRLNASHELQELGSFKALHNTENLFKFITYFISDLSDSLRKTFTDLLAHKKASFLQTVFKYTIRKTTNNLSFKICTTLMSQYHLQGNPGELSAAQRPSSGPPHCYFIKLQSASCQTEEVKDLHH